MGAKHFLSGTQSQPAKNIGRWAKQQGRNWVVAQKKRPSFSRWGLTKFLFDNLTHQLLGGFKDKAVPWPEMPHLIYGSVQSRRSTTGGG